MTNHSTYVGLDVHKETIAVAVIVGERGKVTEEWSMRHDHKAAERLASKVRKLAGGSEVICCYEAGPCGYGFQRELGALGTRCMVIAPSLIPVKPGVRIKTDRRDARKLAELLRAGELVEVAPPTPDEEALRDLCRAREDAKADLTRARHRLSKMLLRGSIRFDAGKKQWTELHHRWLRSLRFENTLTQAVFDNYLHAVEQIGERVSSLSARIENAAVREPHAATVANLRCFRGIDTVAAMTLVSELHGFGRFVSPRQLMAYLGVVPSEHSSGQRRSRGPITRTGNGHVRRMLVEIAWHYRHRPAVGGRLHARREGQPAWVISIADRAQQRLYRKYWRMLQRGKAPNVATMAVARELVGFVWATMRESLTLAHREAA